MGQGLAGSALAVQLLLRKKKVLVFDQPTGNNSSNIAAGLFNPVTGRKMSKTWLADELFPYLERFYRQVEEKTETRFFHRTPIYRPFLSVAEQNEWMGGSVDESLSAFVNAVYTTSQYGDYIRDELGGILLGQSGFIDTKGYIASVRKWLMEEGSYRQEVFNFSELSVGVDGVGYSDCLASYLVFCEGIKSTSNKLFNWLPLRPLKGETLLIQAKFLTDVIVNRGVYIVPNATDQWRIGSTYENDFQDEGITTKGREELIRNLELLVKFDYEVKSQDAGLRPVTPDRKPLLGKHPEHPTVLIFNGMGTKGVSLAPYFSEVLVNFMSKSAGINKEVDINRYKSLYWNSH